MAESKKTRSSGKKESQFFCENLSFAAKEAFKRLRTNLQFCFPDQEGCGVVGITSSHPAEGKSLTSINLCYSLAQLNKKVLLIDADMRRSSVAEKLGLKARPGMSNLLMDMNNASGVPEFCRNMCRGMIPTVFTSWLRGMCPPTLPSCCIPPG